MAGIDASTGVQFAVGQPYAEHFMTNFYLPLISDARNNSSVFWNMIQKVSKEPTSGRFIVWPIRTTRNIGRGAIRPGGQLSDPGAQGGATAYTETRTYQGRIKIDGEIFRRGKTNGGAFIEAQTLEVQGQVEDIMVDSNRMIHNDGSGRLAEMSTVTGGNTSFLLRVNSQIESAATCLTKPTLWIEVGDRIGFYAAGTDTLRVWSGGATQSGFYVTSIVDANNITLSATPGGSNITNANVTGLTAGDWVVKLNTDTFATAATFAKSSGARNEAQGLAGIFQDAGVLDGLGIGGLGTGTAFNQQTGLYDFSSTSQSTCGFQGNACTASVPWNRAVVETNGGSGARPLTEALLQQSFSDAEEQNNANIDLLLSSYSTYNSYVKQLTPDKRYNDTLELKGGHKMLSFNGVPWYKDRYAYGNRVYMVNMEALAMLETEPFQPLAYAGQPVWERLKDQDAYWMGHVTSYQIAVTDVRQRVGALLTDLSL